MVWVAYASLGVGVVGTCISMFYSHHNKKKVDKETLTSQIEFQTSVKKDLEAIQKDTALIPEMRERIAKVEANVKNLEKG